MALLLSTKRKPSHNPFVFNPEKALEVIVYLAKKLPNPTMFHISKILFYADLEHLRNYCRFICGDNYIAMENGAVPSNVYDIFKDVDGRHKHKYFDIPSKESFEISSYNVRPLRDPNLDLLSKSEIKCLDKSIIENGRKSFGELSKMTHEENAYKQADEVTNDMSVFVMAQDFENGQDLVQILSGDC